MSQFTTVALNETTTTACNGERRAAVRLRSNATGSCQTLSLQREADWETLVRDISCNGIGLLLPRRFETGTLLAIELAETSEQKQHLLVARVVHAALQPEGNWLIGCALASALTEEELQSLLPQ